MKSFTIALATAKEAIRQPAFFVLAAIAGFWLIASVFVAYFTFGEDIKMYKDTGLTTISFACLLLALLTASSTVAEEIDGKTAITLLSKPINRRQFIVGKFLGIELGVLALFAPAGHDLRAGRGLQVLLRPPRVGRDRRGGPAVAAGLAGPAGPGAGVLRGHGPDGDQRGDLDPAADAGQPGGLHLDLLPRAPDAGPGRDHRGGQDERAGGVHGPALRVRAALAGILQRRARRSRPARSSPGPVTFCRPSAIACCTVEQPFCSPSSSSRIATWPEFALDP